MDTVSDLMNKDEKIVALLGDVGVFGFRQVFKNHPKRIYNIGILEQSTIGLASGLAISGFTPIVHTIAPFFVERSYEQLKLDFGYQKLGGNFVSVGASYDYAGLGGTHHCPGDVGILKNIPNMSIIVPGTSKEFDILFREAYKRDNPTYYSLSESSNSTDQEVKFGKAKIIKKGKKALVIAVGPMLEPVLEAVKDIDVTVLYYTTLRPFDSRTLALSAGKIKKIVVCEPFYQGTLSEEITEALKSSEIEIENIGVPREFISKYGTAADHDKIFGLDADGIRKKLIKFIK